jgi:hypothetical protein
MINHACRRFRQYDEVSGSGRVQHGRMVALTRRPTSTVLSCTLAKTSASATMLCARIILGRLGVRRARRGVALQRKANSAIAFCGLIPSVALAS